MLQRFIIMTTIWMTALLSLGAKSVRGFRPSMPSTSSAVQLHRRGIHGIGGKVLRATDYYCAFHRQFEGPACKHNNNHNRRFTTSLYSGNTNLITSPKSQTVKKIQALLSKRKQRIKLGQTIVEGPRMVFDLLDNPKTTHLVKQVLVSARDYELRDDYRERLFQEESGDILVQLVHPDIFPDCTDTISPQGIVAIVDIPEADLVDPNDSDVANIAPMYLVLDGVSDPGNLGTLLRSSLAVGVSGVVLLPDCCDPWNPKAVRSAMGASFQIPILETKSREETLEMLSEEGGVQNVYAATMIEEDETNEDAPSASLPYFEVDWTKGPSALVIGSEGNGLSEIVRQDLVAKSEEKTNKSVELGATHIPMEAGIESLNAGVCGSVILFEYARQCQQRT